MNQKAIQELRNEATAQLVSKGLRTLSIATQYSESQFKCLAKVNDRGTIKYIYGNGPSMNQCIKALLDNLNPTEVIVHE